MKKIYNHLNVPTHWEHYWTRYPQGHTILEALIQWVSQVDDMVDNVNDWNTYLDNFVLQFDTELQNTVTGILNDWDASGFLAELINTYTNERIDQVEIKNDQLHTTKVDKSGTGQITWANLSQEAKENIANGAVPVVGVNSVTRENIVNDNVTPEKTNFFTQNPNNPINPYSFVSGALSTTGAVVESASHVVSGFINVERGAQYVIQSREPITGIQVFVALYGDNGVATRDRLNFTGISPTAFPVFSTNQLEGRIKISVPKGVQFDIYLHQNYAYADDFEEPLIVDNNFLKVPMPVIPDLPAYQSNFVDILKRHNTSDAPLKAKMSGDRIFSVYQPVASGKYIEHQFSKNPNDDFIVYASAVIGTLSDTAFTPQQYVMAGSNKEYAVLLKPQGSTAQAQWMPEHNSTGTAFKVKQSILFDGVEKVDQLTPGAIEEVTTVTLTEEMDFFFPGVSTAVGRLYITYTINKEGVTYQGHIDWKSSLTIEKGYGAMLPTVIPPFDTLRTSLLTDYDATKASGSTDITDGDSATSFAFLNKKGTTPNTGYVLAQTINNPQQTLRKGQAGRKEPYPVWLEHRSASVQKLYPQVYDNTTVKAGDSFSFGSTIYVGILHNANQLLK